MRQWIHRVTAQEDGKRAEQILRVSGFSKKEISRLKFIQGGIQADGEQIRSTAVLREGQQLALTLSDSASGAPKAAEEMPSLEICYEDEDVLAVNKPSGISCHLGRGHYNDNLGALAAAYCEGKGEHICIRLIGRLDKDTSGIVLFAKNRAAAARLWKQREDGSFQKVYRVLVHGKPEDEQGCISFPMEKAEGEKNRMRVCEDGMEAVTFYRVLEEYPYENDGISLLECRLKTGRTHQIRVHMAAIGHPVVGDRIYGKEDKAERLCLHAGRLCFFQPFQQKRIEIEVPFL